MPLVVSSLTGDASDCVRLDVESHVGRPPGPLRSVADVERALLRLLHVP